MCYKYSMKNLIAMATVAAALATPALADTTKVRIQDHYKTVIEQQPYKVEVCKDTQVPVYGQKGMDTEGAIIGGIIGGVIGNQIGGGSGKDAATGIGVLSGAIIGGGGNKQQITGYRIERQCQIETRYEETQREVYSHSTITFRENGRNYTLRFDK